MRERQRRCGGDDEQQLPVVAIEAVSSGLGLRMRLYGELLEALSVGVDHQVFLVRPSGLTNERGAPAKGVSRLLRVEDHGIILTNLTSQPGQPLEFSFENVGNLKASNEDSSELSFQLMDSGTTMRFSTENRPALLIALHNRLDEVNGIG